MHNNILDYVKIVNTKLDEYFFFLINRQFGTSGFCFSYENQGKDIPFVRFNIYDMVLYLKNTKESDNKLLIQIGKKLIDIKMNYSFLRTTFEHFYFGPTVIVGNNDIEKLNPLTISLLRHSHYRVYLISALTEGLLDFMQLVFLSKIKDHKKNKWSKILKQLELEGIQQIILPDEQKILIDFKDTYRTAELHKFSKVRAFISKEQWDHFQKEEDILERVLSRLYSKLSHDQ